MNTSPKLKTLILIPLLLLSFLAHSQDRAAWMKEAKWGVMVHYLADWLSKAENRKMDIAEWNKYVDNFDTEGLAKQLNSIGANYMIFTIGQNSGYYDSPNAAYDRFTGLKPGKCSKRDLIADLAVSLKKRGIRLIVYLPSGAPAGDNEAKKGLEYTNGAFPNKEFQLKWQEVIKEWSLRWGDNVAGWWFDGCYWPNTMYRSESEPNFKSFSAAARAGNPKSVVAFNPGVINRSISITPYEDYIAGEISDPELIAIKRTAEGIVDGCQLHFLCYLGSTWGTGVPRFNTEQIIKLSTQVLKSKGAMTWDVPVSSTGLITQPFIDQLMIVGERINK